MNRDIKFRGWNGQTMINWDTLKFSFKGFLEDSGHPVMQYTGLKDKNGKDIYEGDIIQKEYFPLGGFEYHYYHTEVVSLSTLNGVGFKAIRESRKYSDKFTGDPTNKFCREYDNPLKNKKVIHSAIGYEKAERIEVIGNIYENPEILNRYETKT